MNPQKIFLCQTKDNQLCERNSQEYKLTINNKPILNPLDEEIIFKCCKYKETDNWGSANETLFQWASSVPENNPFQTEFLVVFTDGTKNRGRMDLYNLENWSPNLQQHIRMLKRMARIHSQKIYFDINEPF